MGIFDIVKRQEIEKLKDLELKLSEQIELVRKQKEEFNEFYLEHENLLSLYSKLKDKSKPFETIQNAELHLKYKKEEAAEISAKIESLNNEYVENIKIFNQLKAKINLYDEDVRIIDSGLYRPMFNFDNSDEFREQIRQNYEKQKLLIKENNAITSGDDAVYYQHEYKFLTAHYKKSITSYKRLMLIGFNSECDSLIAKAKWNNLESVRLKIQEIFDRINLKSIEFCGFILLQNSIVNKHDHNSQDFKTRFENQMIRITNPFLELKFEELALHHEFEMKKYEEKEEQRRIRELLREEEKARRDFERAKKEADTEEILVKKQLEVAKIQADENIHNVELINRIAELEDKLKAIQEIRERAISMAQQTKRGYIYIISNIGSFGENIYKIGMTRRLDPFERVRELGNASVPFKFDVHTMIFSEDAPTLEHELHKSFSKKRINLYNQRREFFKVTLDEIQNKIKELKLEAEFISIPEAMEYRETQSILERLLKQQVNESMGNPHNNEEFTSTLENRH